jgi:hypothetical protein
LFEGIVMASDLVLVLIPWTGRHFLGGRSEAGISVKTRQLIRNKITRCMKENSRCVDPELRKDLLLGSRRRTAAQRRGRDRTIVIITQSKVGVFRVLQIFDNVCNSLSLWGPRRQRSSGSRSL